jgi:hypothetical protein
MEAAPHRNRRALCGALCLVAVLAVLLGGVARADAATHHRGVIAVTAVAGGDNHAGLLRLDEPGLVDVAAAVLVLAALFAARRHSSAPLLHRLTAGSPAPRGPPGQAR